MEVVTWLGNTHEIIKKYPGEAKQEIGYNLDRIQKGKEPIDWKPMSSVGPGVKEIRVHQGNEYRVLYLAKFEESIYVLHTFVKKTQKTLKKEIDLARKRYTEISGIRRNLE